MKIIFVVSGMNNPNVGMPVVVTNLAKQLKKRGNSVLIYSSLKKDEEVHNRQSTIHYLRFHDNPLINKFKAIRNLLYLLKEFQREKPDIVHINGFHILTIDAAIAARLLRIPYITTLHGLETMTEEQIPRIDPLFYRIVLTKSSAITAVSEFIKKNAQKARRIKGIKVIKNGVDTTQFRPLQIKKKDQIITVQSLYKVKGTDRLIKAFYFIHKNSPKTKFIICGDGPERDKLKRMVNRLGLTGSVKFLGSVNHNTLPRLYNESKVAIFTHSYLPSIESIACGIPTISYAEGDSKEVITPKNGVLVDGGPQEFADEVLKILKGERRFKKQALLDSIQGWSWESITEEYLKVYRRVLHEQRKGDSKKEV